MDFINIPLMNSDRLVIRKTNENDLLYVLQLESTKENRQFILPWDIEKHRVSLFNNDILHLIIEDSHKKIPVGYIILAGLNNPNNSIEIMRITISDKGKGYGKEALKYIKRLVFTNLTKHRLWLDVKVNNERAINLYKALGFVMEGTLRECVKSDEKYESLYIMSILRSEYKNL